MAPWSEPDDPPSETPGWRPDPRGEAHERWWDGHNWTIRTRDTNAVPTPPPAERAANAATASATPSARRIGHATRTLCGLVAGLLIGVVAIIIATSGSKGPRSAMTSSQAVNSVMQPLVEAPLSKIGGTAECNPDNYKVRSTEDGSFQTTFFCRGTIRTSLGDRLTLAYNIEDFSLKRDCFTMQLRSIADNGTWVAGELALFMGTGNRTASAWLGAVLPGQDPDIRVCGVLTPGERQQTTPEAFVPPATPKASASDNGTSNESGPYPKLSARQWENLSTSDKQAVAANVVAAHSEDCADVTAAELAGKLDTLLTEPGPVPYPIQDALISLCTYG